VIFLRRPRASALSGRLPQHPAVSSPDVTRRSAVVVVGAVLLVLFGVLGAAVPVPYVAEVPGPTYNTLGDIDGTPIITVKGRDRNDVKGNLNLTTVGVSRAGLSLVEAVRGWFDGEVSVVPEESVYPPDQTEEETQQQNREAFLTSEQAAESAALGELGYPDKVVVQGLSEGSPSKGELQEGDAIEAIDGRPTPDTDTLDTVLKSIPGTVRCSACWSARRRRRRSTSTSRCRTSAVPRPG
jgi:PDZ domain-containing protein